MAQHWSDQGRYADSPARVVVKDRVAEGQEEYSDQLSVRHAIEGRIQRARQTRNLQQSHRLR